jgi:hypothetical protein
MKLSKILILLACWAIAPAAIAQDLSPYMGGPVDLVEAPNGAIANKKILDGIDEVSWTEPTIDTPAEGIWHIGGYGLVPIACDRHGRRADRL